MTDRAQRNNNPGDLRPGTNPDGSPRILWPGQTGVDPDGFAIFRDYASGDQGARQQVLTDYNLHGLKSPLALAHKYASGPNDDPTAYAGKISGVLGIKPTDDAGLSDPGRLDSYMGALYKNESSAPSEDEILSASGVAAPGAAPQAAAGDSQFLADSGVSAPTDSPAAKEMARLATIPTSDKVQSDINNLIAKGVAAKKSPAEIKSNVATYMASNNLDPNHATGVDDAITFKMKGYTGDSPVVTTKPIEPMSTMGDIGAGLMRGINDVPASLLPVSQYIEGKMPFLTSLDRKVGLPTADEAAAQNAADLAYFNQSAGKTFSGNAGRFGGNALMAAPLMVGGGELVGMGAGALRTAAPVAGPALDFLAGNAGSNFLTRGASLAANGAIQGAGGAALISGGNPAPIEQQLEQGAGAGTVFGPAGAAVGAGFNKLGAAIAPKVDPLVAGLADTAVNKFGINLRGSQISASPIVKRLDTQMEARPFTGFADQNAAQRGQFTQAVGNTFGADSPRLTPEVMSAAKAKIGQTFEDVAAKTPIHADDQLISDLARIEHEAPQALPDSEAKPVLKQIGNVLSMIKPDGTIDGATYQTLTRKGSPLDVAMSNHDSNIGFYAGQVRDALDSALERSAAPEDLASLRAARLAWKNMRTVEPLVSKSDDGTISPALLNQRVSANFKDRAFSGAGDLGELAAIGQRFLKPASTSGTAENIRTNSALEKANAALAISAGIGGHMLGLPTDVNLGAAGLIMGSGAIKTGANKLVASAMSSPAYRNRLISSALNDGGSPSGITFNRNYVPYASIAANRLIDATRSPNRAPAR